MVTLQFKSTDRLHALVWPFSRMCLIDLIYKINMAYFRNQNPISEYALAAYTAMAKQRQQQQQQQNSPETADNATCRSHNSRAHCNHTPGRDVLFALGKLAARS